VTLTTGEPIEIYGVKYPGTAQRTGELTYDADGRLALQQYRFQPSGNLFFDRTILYDDVARRREYFTTVDTTVEIPGSPGAGHGTSYDVVDEDGRIIEFENTRSQEDPPWVLDLRYDDDGHLTTAISNFNGDTATASYVYDCP